MRTLTPWIALAVALLAGLAGGMFTRRRHRADATFSLATALRRAPGLWLLGAVAPALLLGHFALQSAPGVWWSLPPLVERHYLLGIWSLLMAASGGLFGAVVGLAFAERHAERWKAVLASTLTLAALEVPAYKNSRPVAPSLSEHIADDGVVLQTSEVTCAAASAANLLRLAGHAATERSVAEAFDITTFGATTADITLGFASMGIPCDRVEVSLDALRCPAMLFVDVGEAGAENHAVLAVRREADRVEIWDPLDGRRWSTAADLERIWRGRALLCEIAARP